MILVLVAVEKNINIVMEKQPKRNMNIASYIDHTALKPVTTRQDIEKLCREAEEYQFKAVCVPPYYVSSAKAFLKESKVEVATVVGFPLGYSVIAAKRKETEEALADGADEIDMVLNLAALKNGDWDYLMEEVNVLLKPIKERGGILKVIIESGLLSKNEIISCCKLYADAGVHFLKTSTGFAEKGASVEAVKIMRKHLPASILIKAAGGIRTLDFAKELIAAGASRLGCSSSVEIMNQAK